MQTEPITILTGSGEVSSPSEVERIATFVEGWGRKSEGEPHKCDHDPSAFCENYGCSSFVELADEIRRKFLPALLLCALGLGLVGLTGCKTVQAPLPTGAVNTVDATISENLHAFSDGAEQFYQDVQAKRFVPTAEEKKAFDVVAEALNVANPLYQQWHKALLADPTAKEPQQLADALKVVSANIGQLLAASGKVK